MAITLRNICKYAKEDYDIKLVCGDENMDNLVNWVHMLEDPETANFLHGNELIISTGIGHADTEWFVEFAKRLVNSGASGLILNIGPYIEKVPKSLQAYCELVQFPLFTMPWRTRIVDVSNDFCHKIINAEETEVSVASAFRNAIFYPERISEYQSVLQRKAFDLEADFCVVNIALTVPSHDKIIEYEKNVRMHLRKILLGYSDRFSMFRQDRFLIVILQNFPVDIIEEGIIKLKSKCNYGNETFKLTAGIGFNQKGIRSLSQSYKRSMAVLKIAEKQQKSHVSYKDIGIYQLLIAIDDTNILEAFYKKHLGVLDDFDKEHKTEYTELLKIYLDLDNSVEKVASKTFVHRNTINYKIRKIKEILNSDLSYEDGLKIIFSYHIKDYLY